MTIFKCNRSIFLALVVALTVGVVSIGGEVYASRKSDDKQDKPGQVKSVVAEMSYLSETDNIFLKDEDGLINLRWKPIENAENYRVYCSYKKDGPYKVVARNLKTSEVERISVNRDEKVFFKVRAFNKSGKGRCSRPVFVDTLEQDGNVTEISFQKFSKKIYINNSFEFVAQADNKLGRLYGVRWYSSKPSVLKIDSVTGKAEGIKKGSAIVTAVAHNGVSKSIKVRVPGYKKVKVPNVIGDSYRHAKKKIKKAGLKCSLDRRYMSKSEFNDVHPKFDFEDAVAQDQKSGKYIKENSKVMVTVVSESPEGEEKLENMCCWAEKIAADDDFGYTLNCRSKDGKADRLCPFCHKNASKDYDCASLVTAALAHNGFGLDFRVACSGYPPIVGGVADLLLENDWRLVTVNKRVTYKKKGKKKKKTIKVAPPVGKLRRGDILVNRRHHIEIYVGNGMDVGAHWDYDGRPGDSSGREISVTPASSFSHGYTEVYRYNGR